MIRKIARARIDGEDFDFKLVGKRGDWKWRYPDGEIAGEAAGGETKDAALRNLRINLINDEPYFEGIKWV